MSGTAPGEPVNLALNDNAVAFLSYLIPIVGAIVVLNMTPYNRKPDLRFHAWQSLFFSGAWFALHFAIVLLSLPLAFVGLPLIGFVAPLVHLALMAAWVYLMVQALLGKTVRLPVLAEYASQQASKPPTA